MRTACIVVAGGSGTRFGGLRPKQFQELRERPLYEWALEQAVAASDFVVLVVPRDHQAADAGAQIADAVVPGGATRSQSVRSGLAVVPDVCDVVLVHDAARPLASRELFAAVIDAVVAGADAAIPGIPVSDTIKRVHDQPSRSTWVPVVETVERSRLVAVQTPQAFRADVLRRAHQAEPDASDDAGLVEAMGGKVVVVPGEATNMKVTMPQDLAVLELLADL